MVDEIEIKNVGTNGVASEATLQALLKAIEQLAKRSGADPKAAQAKTQDLLNRANTSGIKIITANSDAISDNTKAVDDSTSAFKRLSGLFGLLLNGIGATFGSIVGLAKAFNDGTNRITDFASQLPIIGSYLGKLTGYLDDTFAQYQSLAMAGASFGQSLTDIRTTAAQTGMSLGDFGNFVRTNSDKLAAMSSNVTNGAKALARLNKALGGQREELLGMGFTFEQVNEQLLTYAYMTRSRGRIEDRDAAEVSARAADYAKSLATLSKLTGEDIQSLQDKQVAQNNDLALQMKLTKMLPFQQDRMNTLLLEAQAGGPAMLARMKEIIMGFPPMTEETRLFAATLGKSEAELQKRYQTAVNTAEGSEEYANIQRRNQAAALSGVLEGATTLEDVMAAGSLAGEGVGKLINDMINSSSLDLTKLLGKSGKELEQEIYNQIIAAEDETNARNDSVGNMARFMDTLARVRAAFEIGVISPILEAVTPVLGELVDLFKDVAESDGFNIALDYVKEKLQQLKIGIENFIDAFKNDPKAAVLSAITSIKDGLMILLDPVTTAFNNLIIKMQDTFVNSWLARTFLGIDQLKVADIQVENETITPDAAQNIARVAESLLNSNKVGGSLFGESMIPYDDVLAGLEGQQEELFNRLFAENEQFWSGSTMDLQRTLDTLSSKAAQGTITSEESELVRSIFKILKSEGYANGTNGFENFGKGTLAMLHGHEAVIPMNSPEGKMLSGKSDTSTSLHESISNTIATSNQGTSDSINQLNNTMMQMLSILSQTKDLNAKIEKNTKYSGSDLSRGSISRMSQ